MGQRFHGQVGVDRFCPVTGKNCEVVDLAGSSGFYDQTGGGSQATQYQMLVNRRQSQERRDCHLGG